MHHDETVRVKFYDTGQLEPTFRDYSINGFEYVEELLFDVLDGQQVGPVYRYLFAFRLTYEHESVSSPSKICKSTLDQVTARPHKTDHCRRPNGTDYIETETVWLAPNAKLRELLATDRDRAFGETLSSEPQSQDQTATKPLLMRDKICLELRMRFKPSSFNKLLVMDRHAFELIFAQLRFDFAHSKFTDENKDFILLNESILTLILHDLLRHAIENKIEIREISKRVNRVNFLPSHVSKWQKFVVKHFKGKLDLRAILEMAHKKSGGDVLKVKRAFMDVFLQDVCPNYGAETYCALSVEGPITSQPVELRGRYTQTKVDSTFVIEKRPFTATTSSKSKRFAWSEVCDSFAIDDASLDNNKVTIRCSNEQTLQASFPTELIAASFLALVDGYNRLTRKWYSSICKDIFSPDLNYLRRIKSHGPIGYETMRTKLNRSQKVGSFLVRRCMEKNNRYIIDTILDRNIRIEIDVDYDKSEKLYAQSTYSINKRLDIDVLTRHPSYDDLEALVNDIEIKFSSQQFNGNHSSGHSNSSGVSIEFQELRESDSTTSDSPNNTESNKHPSALNHMAATFSLTNWILPDDQDDCPALLLSIPRWKLEQFDLADRFKKLESRFKDMKQQHIDCKNSPLITASASVTTSSTCAGPMFCRLPPCSPMSTHIRQTPAPTTTENCHTNGLSGTRCLQNLPIIGSFFNGSAYDERFNPSTGETIYMQTAPWRIASSQLRLNGELGRGSSGVVLKGTLSSWHGLTEQVVAVKCVDDTMLSNTSRRDDLLREFEILKSLNHVNIVKPLGFVDESRMMLVVEFLSKGSLLNYLRATPPEMLPTLPLQDWALGIARGMEYLESRSIVHRDLALRNILLGEAEVKICDFGLAQVLVSGNEHYELKTHRALPLRWYAPEAISSSLFSHKTDVWSYGVVLWEMFSRGESPQYPSKKYKDLTETLKHERLPQPISCPDPIYKLMLESCWAYKPENRDSFTTICQHLESIPNFRSEQPSSSLEPANYQSNQLTVLIAGDNPTALNGGFHSNIGNKTGSTAVSLDCSTPTEPVTCA